MEEKLKIDGLSWQPDSKRILKEVSVTFQDGGFYGILGPNGSGKTSLIRHILRLLETKEGSIFLNEQDIANLSRKQMAKKMSLVPQNTYIEAGFTALDIVLMGRAPYQKRFEDYSKEDYQIARLAMQSTNCEHLKDEQYQTLSGGEAQRVITARAIAQKTPWLVLDEPISHLDIRYQVELMEQLKRLNERQGVTILSVLHDINLAASYCKQIVLMKHGMVVAAGLTKEVMTIQNLEMVYDMNFYELNDERRNRTIFVADVPTRK